MEFPKTIYVTVGDEDSREPFLLASEGMPDDEGRVARYRLVEQGEVVVTREFKPGTAIVGGDRDPV